MKFAFSVSVSLLKLQNLSVSMGTEQDAGEQDTVQSSYRRINRNYLDHEGGTLSCCRVGTWATTPNWAPTTRSKKVLVHLRQLRRNLTFFTKLRWGGKFLQLIRWGGGAKSHPTHVILVVMFGVHYLILTWPLLRCLQIPCSRTLGFKNIEQLSHLPLLPCILKITAIGKICVTLLIFGFCLIGQQNMVKENVWMTYCSNISLQLVDVLNILNCFLVLKWNNIIHSALLKIYNESFCSSQTLLGPASGRWGKRDSYSPGIKHASGMFFVDPQTSELAVFERQGITLSELYGFKN